MNAVDEHPVRRPWTAADRRWLAGLSLLALAVYVRTITYGYIFLDDQVYVANNPYVHHGLSWAGVRWAFTGTVVDNWHPLTLLLSLTLSTLFGPTAGVFHMANAVLFATDVGLLFAFLRTSTGRTGPAAAVALLWGLHPLRVESVAWVAELKDVLCCAMWLGCLLADVAYVRQRTGRRYALVLLLAALAMLSKPSSVTLPIVLLLIDVWPLSTSPVSWGRRWVEKLPVFAMAIAVAAATVFAQARPAVLVRIPSSVRLANAVVSIVAYLRQTLWPTRLAVFYPHPWTLRQPISIDAIAASTALIAMLTIAAVFAGRRRPYLIVGWLWFLIVLTPNLGLLQAGDQARADRFTLLPSIGLTVAVVYLVADVLADHRTAAVSLVTTAAAALLACTLRQVHTWRSVDATWAHADTVVPDNYLAKCFRAQIAMRDGHWADAEQFARAAVALTDRTTSEGHLNLARVLDAEGRPAAAAIEYAAAERIAPDDPLLRYQAGLFYDRHGDSAVARRELGRAVDLDPADVAARRAYAAALAANGQRAAAADQYRRLLVASPDDAAARAALAAIVRSAAPNRPSNRTGVRAE